MTLCLRPALIPLAAALLAGCDALGPGGGDRERRPGILASSSDTTAQVTLADTVALGAPVALRVITVGNGCTRQGETEVDAAPRAADVRVYDYAPRPSADVVCPDIRVALPHEATLRFTQPGAATVRIHGRREPGGAPLVITRAVVVR